MTFDYHATRRELLTGARHIGRRLAPTAWEDCMSLEQRKRIRAKNVMTDERWEVRSLAGDNLTVELAYGWFLDRPLFGVTVFCVRGLAADAAHWDHALSGCFNDVPSVLARLRELDEGGRERLAALAEAAS